MGGSRRYGDSDDVEEEDEGPQFDPIDITSGGKKVGITSHSRHCGRCTGRLAPFPITALPTRRNAHPPPCKRLRWRWPLTLYPCLACCHLQLEPSVPVAVRVRDMDLEVTKAADWGAPTQGDARPGTYHILTH